MPDMPQDSGTSATGGSGSNNEVLEELVKELNDAILALRTLIEHEYPNRREIEARFVNKTTWDARLKVLFVTIVLSSFLSFGATIGTMAECYLSTNQASACNLIPGWENNEQKRQDRHDQISKIDDLENRIEELESR